MQDTLKLLLEEVPLQVRAETEPKLFVEPLMSH
jgi:hypothetical protein